MPSGPKKRKAIKKKENLPKEDDANAASSSSLPHSSHGEDLKQQEAERSDNLNVRVEEKERNRLDVSSGDELGAINETVNDEKETARKSYSGASMGSFGSTNKSDDVASACDSVKLPDSLFRSSVEANNVSGSGKTVARVAPIENPVMQVDDQIKANGDRNEVTSSMPHMNVTGSEWKDKAVVYPVGNIATQEIDIGLSLSYNATATVHGAGEDKDLGANEPLLATSHHPVEKSSWKSCCGLFEAFSTSSA